MFPLPRGSWCTRHGPEDNITRIGCPESQSTRLQIPKMKCATIVPKQLQAYAVSQNDHVNVYVLRSCAVLLRWSVGPFLLELCGNLERWTRQPLLLKTLETSISCQWIFSQRHS
jgi:hypothetical protein